MPPLPTQDRREWMTPREYAAAVGLCVDTVYRMVARGELLARRFGRVLRIPRRLAT